MNGLTLLTGQEAAEALSVVRGPAQEGIPAPSWLCAIGTVTANTRTVIIVSIIALGLNGWNMLASAQKAP